ncbi:hypothetical protein TWF281_001546 [Arthrobotrys megalospora]
MDSATSTQIFSPHILKLPNEVLELILDEIVPPQHPFVFVDTKSVDYVGTRQHETLQLWPIVLTCRRFCQLVTPRLYTYCFFRYLKTGHKDIYYWKPTFPLYRAPGKYSLYQKYGAAVKLLSPLFASFINLREGRFHLEVDLESRSSIQPYIDGIQDLLKVCLTLKKLLIHVRANVVICDLLKCHRREESQQRASSVEIGSAYANLDDLHLACIELWAPANDKATKRGAAFSVLELFCDTIWPSAKTVKSLYFDYQAQSLNEDGDWVPANLRPQLSAKYELPMLEKLSISTSEYEIMVFDEFFAFKNSRLKGLELRDIYWQDYGVEEPLGDNGNWEGLSDTLLVAA